MGYSGPIVESALDAILSADSDRRIVQFNPAAARLFAISREEALGEHLSRFIPARFHDAHFADLQSFATADVPRSTVGHLETITALRADGSEFPVDASISRSSVDGAPILTVFLRDATQRKMVETQLQRTKIMDAVAQLSGGVAHDFNNLLMVILGNLELMEASRNDEALVKEFTQEARIAAERGTALARQLLTFSRKSPPPRHPADVNAVVAHCERQLRRALGDRFRLTLVPSSRPCVVECDTAQLEQLLLNLVMNARDAMSDDGTVTILVDVHDLSMDSARWPTLPDGAYVRICVSDNGAGMSDEARRRAFEPFFTTKQPGHAAGLGLAAVFGIATQLGGGVDVESSTPAGSTFTVLLPRSDKPLADGAASAVSVRRRGHGVVLLVDDEPSVRSTVRMILTQNGYTVIEAADGREALIAYEDQGGRVDLVLSDLRMPKLDGRALVAKLRSERPDLPVLLMSGYDDQTDSMQPQIDDPAESVLQKPFTAPALLDAIAERLA